MTEPLFSVVITCHNQRDYIADAVESALAQTPRSKQVIVVDDCSDDGSAEVLARYSGSAQLDRLETHQGAIAARNRGVSIAGGRYIVFLDGDDVLIPWALEVYERVILDRQPKLIFAASHWFEGAIPEPPSEPCADIEFFQYPHFLSKDRAVEMLASKLIVDRISLKNAGCWTEGIFQMDVVDLCMKLGFAGRAILLSAPVTVHYRVHAANISHSVLPFVRNAHHLIAKVKSLGASETMLRRFQRQAHLGGVLAFWVKKAIRARLFSEALGLARSGWYLVLAAIAGRAFIIVRGRRRAETIARWPSRQS